MVTFTDVERAIAIRDPQLGALIVRYLAQDDPGAGVDEVPPADAGIDAGADPVGAVPAPAPVIPPGAATIDRLRTAVSERGLANKTTTERKLARREAFAAAEASRFAPPRLRLGRRLVALYDAGDPEARAALLEVLTTGTMKWGVWQAAKLIYKRAEAGHDAAFFGALAYRFDA